MSEAIALALPTDERRPWARAVAWLCLLGPFFFLSYGTANWLAAQRAEVGSVVFDWEHAIPFLAWTIIPYWSIDAFYGLSLFVCANKAELDTHTRRLLTAQIVAVTCFILLPLRFTFERPQATGVAGALFDVLTSFDKPFNQAPPLHIALLVILWPLYARHVPRWALWLLHPWFALLFVSVLTTYQHHFIDLPTGALLGFFCLWLWPDGAASPVAGARIVDLCAELPSIPRSRAIPMLDLIVPAPEQLARAAAELEQARSAGRVLVCCALGYSRNAAAVAAWLLSTGRAADVDAAIAEIRHARPRIVLDTGARAAIAHAASLHFSQPLADRGGNGAMRGRRVARRC